MQDEFAAAGGERLSALADGEVEVAEAVAACRAWQSDAACRRDWHAWHVIGDVLRSDELARGAEGDGAFVARLRLRLAAEPVVLAPAPLPAAAFAVRRRTARRFALPIAAAAGVVFVAGTFVAIQPGSLQRGPAGVEVAGVSGAGPVAMVPAGTAENVAAAPILARNDVRLIRDARLDGYLAAHKQFAGSTAPGLPSATLRNATVRVEGR